MSVLVVIFVGSCKFTYLLEFYLNKCCVVLRTACSASFKLHEICGGTIYVISTIFYAKVYYVFTCLYSSSASLKLYLQTYTIYISNIFWIISTALWIISSHSLSISLTDLSTPPPLYHIFNIISFHNITFRIIMCSKK